MTADDPTNETRTRYEGAPAVVMRSLEDGMVTVEVTYQTEPRPRTEAASFARATFSSVLAFRWMKFEYYYFAHNREVSAFDLIEVADSTWIQELLRNSLFQHRVGEFYLDEPSLRHFRLSFDDYGVFDLICGKDVEVDHFRGVRSSIRVSYPLDIIDGPAAKPYPC